MAQNAPINLEDLTFSGIPIWLLASWEIEFTVHAGVFPCAPFVEFEHSRSIWQVVLKSRYVNGKYVKTDARYCTVYIQQIWALWIVLSLWVVFTCCYFPFHLTRAVSSVFSSKLPHLQLIIEDFLVLFRLLSPISSASWHSAHDEVQGSLSPWPAEMIWRIAWTSDRLCNIPWYHFPKADFQRRFQFNCCLKRSWPCLWACWRSTNTNPGDKTTGESHWIGYCRSLGWCEAWVILSWCPWWCMSVKREVSQGFTWVPRGGNHVRVPDHLSHYWRCTSCLDL